MAQGGPIWRTIHDSLKSEIAAGVFKTGDKLPTEAELSARFAVNRHTVRRALAELTGEGVIHVRRGSGAYVAEGMLDYRLGRRVKFSQNVAELGRTPSHRLLEARRGPAEETAARHLKLRSGAETVTLELLSEVDGLPIHVSTHVFPFERFPDLAERFAQCLSVSAALAHYGVIDYTRSWTRIMAHAPSRAIAAKLRQADHQPVLRAEGVNLDMSGAPVEFVVAFWAGARAQFLVES